MPPIPGFNEENAVVRLHVLVTIVGSDRGSETTHRGDIRLRLSPHPAASSPAHAYGGSFETCTHRAGCLHGEDKFDPT